jgi:hypothetical protein
METCKSNMEQRDYLCDELRHMIVASGTLLSGPLAEEVQLSNLLKFRQKQCAVSEICTTMIPEQAQRGV